MKAIISVVGNDRVGILAMVANACADHGINILEVDQTILDGIFSMTMMVDMKEMEENFETFAREMEEIGINNALIIRVMNKKIFDAMHSI